MTVSHLALQMSDSAAVLITFDGKHKQESECLSSTTNTVSEPHEPGIAQASTATRWDVSEAKPCWPRTETRPPLVLTVSHQYPTVQATASGLQICDTQKETVFWSAGLFGKKRLFSKSVKGTRMSQNAIPWTAVTFSSHMALKTSLLGSLWPN